MLKLGPVIEVLAELANDREAYHTQDAAWARKVLPLLTGPAGFARLVNFAVDTDFAVVAHLLTRLQDTSATDVVVSDRE
eukprot:8813855-Lingulodinium_polyedra.AAC.1